MANFSIFFEGLFYFSDNLIQRLKNTESNYSNDFSDLLFPFSFLAIQPYFRRNKIN